MKKRICLLLCLVMIACLSGCSSEDAGGHSATKAGDISNIVQSAIDAEDNEQGSKTEETSAPKEASQAPETEDTTAAAPPASTASPETPAPETTAAPETQPVASDVDVDLTVLSSSMVYAEVYNMVTDPENYIGKTVRMYGPYTTAYVEETDTRYFACIIQDATACCAQGIEFVLTDEYVWPEDYPEEGEEITVVGYFDTYYEEEYLYCTLRDAVIE